MLLLAASLLLVQGCRAGPSAFDDASSGEAGVPDTAEVAELGEIPRAPDVEPADSSLDLTGGEERVPAPADGSGAGGQGAMGGEADGGPAPGGGEGLDEADGSHPGVGARAALDDGAPRFTRPEHVRGLYLNAWASGSTRRVDALLELAKETEVNSFVIDIKDATGYVSHRTQVPLAREIGATGEVRIRDLSGLLVKLHDAGIYPIARIVIVKDPLLSAGRPELAVQDTAGGVWVDSKDIVWLNIHDRRVWDYHVELAEEVARMGFREIQWDYVRFPDAPRSDLARAVFPGSEGRDKADAVRAFLDYSREELGKLGVTVTADVFGVTTSASRDVGIGQVWERFIDVVDVALPMVYPSHYWRGSFGIDEPNAYPYEVVKEALEDALRRSEGVEGAGATRPWLQDFSLGQPPYGAPEVRAQIQATYDVGIREWILWNPGSRYTEEALEPVDGFTDEPHIRVADQVVPVSRRWDLLAASEPEVTAPDAEDQEAAPDSIPAGVAVDAPAAGDPGPAAAGQGAVPDVPSADTIAADSTGARAPRGS